VDVHWYVRPMWPYLGLTHRVRSFAQQIKHL
jgi:hypothetical protein